MEYIYYYRGIRYLNLTHTFLTFSLSQTIAVAQEENLQNLEPYEPVETEELLAKSETSPENASETVPEKSLTQKLEELKHGTKPDITKPDITLEQLFPHEKLRPGQDELVKDLEQAFSSKKILIAHAPTGMGKTASALSVALHTAITEKKKVFFLTNRHTQHKIAVDTLKLMQKKSGQEIQVVDLIGKKWMCNQEVAGLFSTEFNEYCKSVVEKGECEFYNNVKNKKKELSMEVKLALRELKLKEPLHNEELKNFCHERRLCSYETALLLAKSAQVLIGDYYYLFNPFVSQTILQKMELEMQNIILILDEGHNLPGRVADMLSSVLTSTMLKNGIYEAKKFGYGGVIGWLQELNRIINTLADFPVSASVHEKEKKVSMGDFIEAVKKVVNYEQLLEELELAADEVRQKQRKSYLGGIAAFLGSWKGPDEGFVRYIAIKNSRYGEVVSLTYACLDPSVATKDIFQQLHAGVVMSGTLKPTFMYKDVLGIGERALEKEYVSPFPPENKLSIIIPETSTKYSLRNDLMFKKIGEKCAELCRLIPGNVALFFPSYDLRDKVGSFITAASGNPASSADNTFSSAGSFAVNSTPVTLSAFSNSSDSSTLPLFKKFLWEKAEMSKEEKEQLLNQFRAEKNRGAVLLGVAGANFAEGIDLPGDLLNGVVVVGLPLARPDLITREVINYYDRKFGKGWSYGYLYPAMNKCLQSAGRCIRSETDRGVIVYLDERFAWEMYYGCFPRERLVVSKDYGRLLREFFNKGDLPQ